MEMVRRFIAVAALSLMTAGQNLDFEGGLDAKGRPTGWVGKTPGYSVLLDPVDLHGGQVSVRIQRNEKETTDKKSAPIVQTLPAKDWRGKRVRLSGWLRTRDVDGGFGALWMRIDSETTPNLAFDNMSDRAPRGTSDWKPYEVVLDVPPTADYILFGIVLASEKGTVWADDLKVEEVGKTVAVTK